MIFPNWINAVMKEAVKNEAKIPQIEQSSFIHRLFVKIVDAFLYAISEDYRKERAALKGRIMPLSGTTKPSPISLNLASQPKLSPKLQNIKDLNSNHVALFTQWAASTKWSKFSPSSVDGHYDWWAFPITRAGAQHQECAVTKDEIEQLKQDPEFMKNYREGLG